MTRRERARLSRASRHVGRDDRERLKALQIAATEALAAYRHVFGLGGYWNRRDAVAFTALELALSRT